MNVGIIGSGIAAIACSIRLRMQGNNVTIIEANSYPGGKLTSFASNGYHFDAGPSLFTMPENVEELFHLTKKQTPDYFNYIKLDDSCYYFYEDGTIIEGKTNVNDFAEEVEKKLGTPKQQIIDYLEKSEEIYTLTSKLFLQRSLHKIKTYLDFSLLKTLFKIKKLNLNKTMNEVNETFFEEPKLVQLFNRFATYNGSDPYQAPAVLNIIPHLEHNMGTYFPKGGMRSITNSLYTLSKEMGVHYSFNEKVQEIIVEKKKIKGIQTTKGTHKFDRVVSNMDIYPTYRKLLRTHKAPEKILRQQRSSSALIFYWGIKRTFKQLSLHNIFFSENYKKEFDYIFKEKNIYHDPTVYINISSKHNPSDAPKNCENWFVMINVPHHNDQDWDQLIAKARNNIIEKLNRMLDTSIEDFIETEEILDPRNIESKTSSYKGALYGASSNNKMAAFLRHKNFSNKIKGLYFVGGSVHPGGGIPLCLLSAKIVSENFK